MIRSKLEGVDFLVANPDAQPLQQSLCERRIQLGSTVTKGLGAGDRPDVGRMAAEEAVRDIAEQLAGSNMVFITAGVGGGTGTGAGPVVAQIAREQGILTVGVVTKPFQFEGTHRARVAEAGIEELQQFVDTLIVIPNQNLFRVANEKTPFADAFAMADDVLHCGVRGVTDLMVVPGLISRYATQRRTLLATLHEYNAQLLREREMVAGQARLRERQRIAQDIHDSLGHQLSLISLHTGALQVDRELTGRQRQSVDVLHDASGPFILVPVDPEEIAGLSALLL